MFTLDGVDLKESKERMNEWESPLVVGGCCGVITLLNVAARLLSRCTAMLCAKLLYNFTTPFLREDVGKWLLLLLCSFGLVKAVVARSMSIQMCKICFTRFWVREEDEIHVQESKVCQQTKSSSVRPRGSYWSRILKSFLGWGPISGLNISKIFTYLSTIWVRFNWSHNRVHISLGRIVCGVLEWIKS